MGKVGVVLKLTQLSVPGAVPTGPHEPKETLLLEELELALLELEDTEELLDDALELLLEVVELVELLALLEVLEVEELAELEELETLLDDDAELELDTLELD